MAINKKKIQNDPILGSILQKANLKKPRTLLLDDRLFTALQGYCDEINETSEGGKAKVCQIIDKLIYQFLEERGRIT